MKNNQRAIPGLEELIKAKANADKSQEALEEVFRPLAQLIASLQERVLKLELEVSLLRILVENPRGMRDDNGNDTCQRKES